MHRHNYKWQTTKYMCSMTLSADLSESTLAFYFDISEELQKVLAQTCIYVVLWYQCPLCQQDGGYAQTTILHGLDEITDKGRKLFENLDQADGQKFPIVNIMPRFGGLPKYNPRQNRTQDNSMVLS